MNEMPGAPGLELNHKVISEAEQAERREAMMNWALESWVPSADSERAEADEYRANARRLRHEAAGARLKEAVGYERSGAIVTSLGVGPGSGVMVTRESLTVSASALQDEERLGLNMVIPAGATIEYGETYDASFAWNICSGRFITVKVPSEVQRMELDRQAIENDEFARFAEEGAEWKDKEAVRPELNEQRDRARRMAGILVDRGFSLNVGGGSMCRLMIKGWDLGYIDMKTGEISRASLPKDLSDLQSIQDELIVRLVEVGAKEE